MFSRMICLGALALATACAAGAPTGPAADAGQPSMDAPPGRAMLIGTLRFNGDVYVLERYDGTVFRFGSAPADLFAHVDQEVWIQVQGRNVLHWGPLRYQT